MTDEEKAEEYVLYIPDTVDAKHSVYSEEKLKQAYLDGLTEGRKEKWHEIAVLKEQNKIILEENDALNEWVDELKEQIELIRKFFNVNEMKEFASYVLYYTANPASTMCIPNCVYEKVDEMYNAWFKKCDTCNYSKTCGMRSVFEEAKNKDRNAICGEWKLVE